jgi:hypothetical protein
MPTGCCWRRNGSNFVRRNFGGAGRGHRSPPSGFDGGSGHGGGWLAVKVAPQPITAFAVAKVAAAGGSTLILTKEALKLMAWTKMETTIIVGIILAAIAVPARVHIPVPLAHPPVFLAAPTPLFYMPSLRPGRLTGWTTVTTGTFHCSAARVHRD